MSLSAIMNSTTLYIAVIVGLLLIFLLCAVMLKMAWGRCIELGISREKVKDVIKSSVIFSIVPSLSIVIGLFSLAASVSPLTSHDKLVLPGRRTGCAVALVPSVGCRFCQL